MQNKHKIQKVKHKAKIKNLKHTPIKIDADTVIP